MSTPYDSSYDRRQATLLAQKMRKASLSISKITPVSSEPAAGEVTPGQSDPTPARDLPQPPEIGFRDPGIYREQVWNALLDWARELCHTSWAYASDEKGLVIAERGEADPVNGERIVSSTVQVQENLRSCTEQRHQSKLFLALIDEWWLTLLYCNEACQDEQGLIIGMVGEQRPDIDRLGTVHRIFSERLRDA